MSWRNEPLPPAISGGLNIFNEHTSQYKWRVYITGLWPTAAGTIPLLSPVIWLSPSLLATEGKGYYSFVAFESSVLSELPSLSSSSQITVWGIFMTTSQFSPEKAIGGSRWHCTEDTATAKPNKAKSQPSPLLPLCSLPPTVPVNPPLIPSQTVLQKNLNWLKLKEKETWNWLFIRFRAMLFLCLTWLSEPTPVRATPGKRGRAHGCPCTCGGRTSGSGTVRVCACVRERRRERGRMPACDSPTSPPLSNGEPERHSSLRAITTNDLCGQSRGPARVLISSPEKGAPLECYQGAWD